MFMVFWVETQYSAVRDAKHDCPRCKEFTDMSVALSYMETLRAKQREQERDGAVNDVVRHVTMSSENPNSVGRPGVADPSPDYSWTKRRGNMPGLKK